MEILTTSFSLNIVQQIISEIVSSSLDEKLTKFILSTSNLFSKQFYSAFLDQTVEETIFSGIVPNKLSQFELTQRPKYVESIDEEPQCNQTHKRFSSLFSKILSKKSIKQQIRIQSSKSAKIIKNQKRKSQTKLQSLNSKANQQSRKQRKYFLSNPKQKNQNLIKLKIYNQNKDEQSTHDISKLQQQIRNKRIQEKQYPLKIQKSPKLYHIIKKKSKSLPNQNFPLLQNVNHITFQILDRNDIIKNHKNTTQALKIDKNVKNNGNKKCSLYPSKSCTKIPGNVQNTQISSKKYDNSRLNKQDDNQSHKYNNFGSKSQKQCYDLSTKKSHQKLMIQKNIEKSLQKSLTIFGARQRRASQINIHSEALRKIDQCKTKNFLKIKPKKQIKNLQSEIIPKRSNQKLIINNKDAVKFLLNSSPLEQPSLVIQNGAPKLYHENTIGIKTI